MIKPEFSITADGRQLDATTMTDNYIKAVNVNRNIIVNAQAAQMSLYEVCKGLKEMRDGKLYKELGYQNFEEYCENETGIKYKTAHKYIKIIETLNIENISPARCLGVEKLYLLTTLSEEERVEITENNNLEEISKRELESKVKEIKALREKTENQQSLIETLEKKATQEEQKSYRLSAELDALKDHRDELCRQIEELESRPIDVAVSDSHEIENLKKAMKTCDDQWAAKYGELEENTIIEKRELHQSYRAEIEKLKAEHEQKLAEVSQTVSTETVPDMKETFKAYYSMAYNSFNTMMGFVKKQSETDRQFCLEKTAELLDIFRQAQEG